MDNRSDVSALSSRTPRNRQNAWNPRSSLPLPPATLGGLLAAILAVMLMAFALSRSDEDSATAAERINHTFQVEKNLALLLSTLKDAETGQRGYLLTADDRYLEPYATASKKLAGEVQRLRALTADNPSQQQRLDTVETIVGEKQDELARTIDHQRSGDAAGALAIVRTDRGKAAMDQLRNLLGEMDREEQRLLETRQQNAKKAADFARSVTWGGSALLLSLICGTAFILSREHAARETEAWLKEGQASLMLQSQGEQTLGELGDAILRFLAKYLDALTCAMYALDDGEHFRRVAGFALPDSELVAPTLIRPGEGLAGQAIDTRTVLHVRNVPAGYLAISSSLGKAQPSELLIVPLQTYGRTMGVIELGFFRQLHRADVELMSRAAEPIAFAIASSKYKARLRDLLEVSQRQAEELQAQQSELEAQQAELETTNEEMNQANALLEVQTIELERQRDEVVQARDSSEKASRYKSEFLANMSHELRTPLNSSLILARLLADNREGNLNPDQIRSAETIYSAGNDLLVLINDILDLSKIEAGRADVVVETVILTNVAERLERSFRAIAKEKKLQFRITTAGGSPAQITTDGRRLEQILKNLLSNAFKFTESGEVELVIAAPVAERVQFSVRDTGIGIAPQQQEVIFEAFRQEDGTTSRKYGGTGLGLTISRELAHLLGGELVVKSSPGSGSVFTLDLPLTRSEAQPPAEAARPAASELSAGRASDPPHSTRKPGGRRLGPPPFPDDRETLNRQGRLILVVEDDSSFARILFELAHELDFDCVVASTADEGLLLARDLQPSGILLDIGLPDASGLFVLERLKGDPATRHLPIHIVSSSDSSQIALELGAVGYALKPVAREELVTAMHKLQAHHAREIRRVLVVEDDLRQQESIKKLLQGQGVELVTAGSVKEALTQLERLSVDCMVLDLTLPDGSGYDLLQKMAEGTRYSFPPVIVYTGRDLELGDEEKLRRYSRSIIVKGARSPERLLDEVTLFLHRVESSMQPEQRRILEEARHRDTAFEGRRILVVEDDVRNVFALTKVLEPRGAKIEIARNGLEALRALDSIPDIDLVLMDLMMPEMDGLTAIREIRKKEKLKGLPIIALTAKAMLDDREQAMAAGANDYMAKPFEVDKLISLCRVWLPR